jgi:hypothetical protein
MHKENERSLPLVRDRLVLYHQDHKDSRFMLIEEKAYTTKLLF